MWSNDLETARLLLKAGARTELRFDGETPLLYAARLGREALILELVAWKANVRVKDAKGIRRSIMRRSAGSATASSLRSAALTLRHAARLSAARNTALASTGWHAPPLDLAQNESGRATFAARPPYISQSAAAQLRTAPSGTSSPPQHHPTPGCAAARSSR
ncbi:MAG TPA: hypothetical protein VIS07_07780, partial [Candidatus Binatia bacterium]